MVRHPALNRIYTRLKPWFSAGGVNEERLNARYKDHKLIGNFIGRRECHIEPDWLLIYKTNDDEIIFERTGTHSDLFD